MSIFKAPKGTIDEIGKIRRKFLWGGVTLEKKMSKIRWSNVCRAKNRGGLGVGFLKEKNHALLCKWWWKFINDNHYLWKKVICMKFGWDEDTLFPRSRPANGGIRFSKYWKGIMKIGNRESIKSAICSEAFRWILGSGHSIRFWSEVWIDSVPLCNTFQGSTHYQYRRRQGLIKCRYKTVSRWNGSLCLEEICLHGKKVRWRD